jgi:hypothetical protein
VANQPVVLDGNTGLTWQGCPAGLTGNACDKGTIAIFEWQDAIDYCNSLDWGGYQDWRLPDETTLLSIVNYGETDPSIDATAFPATPAYGFWSSSISAGDSNSAWIVDFYYGNTFAGPKCCLDSSFVRCVRGGS